MTEVDATGPFALDTNGYAEIAAGTPTGARLRTLLARERTRLVVLLPVISEVAQRSANPEYQRDVRARFYEAVPDTRRLVPDATDWLAVGRLVATLTAAGHDPNELRRRNFYLDLHVAVMCRARGVTLVTRDRDHERIRPHVGHRTEPFPA